MTSWPEQLHAWVSAQRWFSGKAHAPRWRELTTETAEVDGARIVTHFLMDEGGRVPTLYHVPTVERAAAAGDGVLIGTNDDGDLVYDATHDPAYLHSLVRELAPELAARFTGGSVLTGEQSNTSVVLRFDSAPEIICKVFRALHDGVNPDVTLQAALSAAGSPFVPRFVGSTNGEWPDAARSSGTARGSLTFAQEFLASAEDGWRLALRSALANSSFAAAANELGAATAEVHATLASVMPTIPTTDAVTAPITAAWSARLDLAAREVPGLAAQRAAIDSVYSAVTGTGWPPLQRVHGDLHLGQALAVQGRGWVLVDFEGEPLRPMSERDRPDSTLRDVAGMLRSFDYAAGATPGWPIEWAAECRRAFLDGYSAASGVSLEQYKVLLDAFELDKAVYEALYEARNRPSWLGIPLAGIERILAG